MISIETLSTRFIIASKFHKLLLEITVSMLKRHSDKPRAPYPPLSSLSRKISCGLSPSYQADWDHRALLVCSSSSESTGNTRGIISTSGKSSPEGKDELKLTEFDALV